MTNIANLTAILDWKLLVGSHEFPGSDGGTCLNEVALVAAGFPYMSVTDVTKLPVCFSRVLASFAMFVNDRLDDDARQALLPFALRLAGTTDAPDIERMRADFIIDRVCDEVLRPHLAPDHFQQISWQAHCEAQDNPIFGLCRVFKEHHLLFDSSTVMEAFAGGISVKLVQRTEEERPTWATYLTIFDAVCRIGKQPEPIEHSVAAERAAAVKRAGAVRLRLQSENSSAESVPAV